MDNDGLSEAIAVTGWAVISPIGIGREAFAEALLAQRSGERPLAGAAPGEWPGTTACPVPEFEAARFLGSKGTRVLDRTTALAVVATGQALRDGGVEVTRELSEQIGVVLGTSNGSGRSTFDFTRETLTAKKPYLVSPELFPNTVMNGAAAQCAIWHKLRALNTTIAGARLAGLLCLRYAARMLRLGYAQMLVAGAVEELSQQMAWVSHIAAQAHGERPAVPGEGCAMFLLEPTQRAREGGRRPLAEVLSCETAVRGRLELGEALAGCVRRAMERAGVAPSDVWAVSRRASGLSQLDAAEEDGLRRVFTGLPAPRELRVGHLVGECFSASGAFQLAALIALFTRAAPPGRIGLVPSVTHSGGVGCAVVAAG